MDFSTTYMNASAAADSVFSDALVTVDRDVVIKVYVKFLGGSWQGMKEH